MVTIRVLNLMERTETGLITGLGLTVRFVHNCIAGHRTLTEIGISANTDRPCILMIEMSQSNNY